MSLNFENLSGKEDLQKFILSKIKESSRAIVADYLNDPHEFGVEIRVEKNNLQELTKAFQNLGFQVSAKDYGTFVKLSILPKE